MSCGGFTHEYLHIYLHIMSLCFMRSGLEWNYVYVKYANVNLHNGHIWPADSVDQLGSDNNQMNESHNVLPQDWFKRAIVLDCFEVFGCLLNFFCYGVCGVVVVMNMTVRANVFFRRICRCLNIFLYQDVLLSLSRWLNPPFGVLLKAFIHFGRKHSQILALGH